MAAHYIWFAVAVVLVIAELASLTLYLLMLALGALAAGIGAMLGVGLGPQLVIAALVALVGFAVLRRLPYGKVRRGAAATDPNVNLDIGQEVEVPVWDAEGRARVPYRGAQWNVELRAGAAPVPGRYRIVEVRGNTLFVMPR
jgi:membrane protein implicated in regulation of membrane protease activity